MTSWLDMLALIGNPTGDPTRGTRLAGCAINLVVGGTRQKLRARYIFRDTEKIGAGSASYEGREWGASARVNP